MLQKTENVIAQKKNVCRVYPLSSDAANSQLAPKSPLDRKSADAIGINRVAFSLAASRVLHCFWGDRLLADFDPSRAWFRL